MKRLLLTSALLLSILFVGHSTEARNEILRISMINNEQIQVEVNGRVSNVQAQRLVDVQGLRPGVQQVKVYATGRGPRPGRGELLYDGDLYLRQDCQLDVVIDPSGIVRMTETTNRAGTYPGRPPVGIVQPPPMSGAEPMSPQEFSSLKASLKERSFDDKKLDLLRVVAGDNLFLTGQVMDLVKDFSFSGSQLEVAKLLYPYTLDRNNYYKVGEAFTFSSNKSELDKFLMNQPK